MRHSLLTLLLALGFCPAAQAAILSLGNPVASIVGSATTVDLAGTTDADDFTGDAPSLPLPLSGAAAASTPGGSTAVSSAFVDEGFLFVDTEVFDLDESAEASAFADLRGQITGDGGVVTLVLDVDHRASAAGADAFTATELLIQVFGPGGGTLVDLFLPLGASDVLSMFDPSFALGAGAVADIVLTLFGESSSALFGEARSATAVSFQLIPEARAANPVDGTPTVVLLLLAFAALLGSRRARARR